MTLLDKMAEAIEAGVSGDLSSRAIAEQALTALLTPTTAQVNRMGAQALSGPQTDGPTVYPAAMWQAGVRFILEEQDREPEAEPEVVEAEQEIEP